MSNGKIAVTVTGNLTADPDVRFTNDQGTPVANFSVASTPRQYNAQSQQWEDGDTTYMRCTAWREQAENVADSLRKGDRVTVTGDLVQRSYETKEGEKRTTHEVEGDEVSASLRYAKVRIEKQAKTNGRSRDRSEAGGGACTGPTRTAGPGMSGSFYSLIRLETLARGSIRSRELFVGCRTAARPPPLLHRSSRRRPRPDHRPGHSRSTRYARMRLIPEVCRRR